MLRRIEGVGACRPALEGHGHAAVRRGIRRGAARRAALLRKHVHHQREAGCVRAQHRRIVRGFRAQGQRGDQRLHFPVQPLRARFRHGDHDAEKEALRLHGEKVPLAARVCVAPAPCLRRAEVCILHALVGQVAACLLGGEEGVAAPFPVAHGVEGDVPPVGDLLVFVKAVLQAVAVGFHGLKFAVEPQKPFFLRRRAARQQQQGEQGAQKPPHWMVLMS